MKEYIQQLQETADLAVVRQLIDAAVADAREDRLSPRDRGAFLRSLLLNGALLDNLSISEAIDYLLSRTTPEEWSELFGGAVEKAIAPVLADLVDRVADCSHTDVLRLAAGDPTKALIAALKGLDGYLKTIDDGSRLIRGMRVARMQVDLYRQLADPNVWRRRRIPACCIDSDEIRRLKEKKAVEQLPAAYETRINQLQHEDLRRCLEEFQALATAGPRGDGGTEEVAMREADFDVTFEVRSPLRVGISSANASDNHLRTKERGGKSLNAGIDLAMDGGQPAPPLVVSARRLDEPRLVLRSLSTDFKADFEANARGDAAAQSELFFAYRRGGDESLRMVKQALVHVGIVDPSSQDIVSDLSRFTGGGGLEITTASQVLQGSGLGTSSILAAAILKVLYRLTGAVAGSAAGEYPALYDQSVLLEHSLGLNSGWQDARGACGGPGAVKDFYAPPTEGLPAPELSFVDIEEELFVERLILFNTGISRKATRGLNVVLEAYLSRDRAAFPAIGESLLIHEEIVAALRAADYPALGRLATRYWQLRCILDPGATSDVIQHLFESPELSSLSEGGMLTGAGGGGFAMFVARDGAGEELRERLASLAERKAYGGSGVVEYRLNRAGLQLTGLAAET